MSAREDAKTAEAPDAERKNPAVSRAKGNLISEYEKLIRTEQEANEGIPANICRLMQWQPARFPLFLDAVLDDVCGRNMLACHRSKPYELEWSRC